MCIRDRSCKNYGYEPDPELHKIFTEYHKTHNQGVFDAYTPEMRKARHSHICLLYTSVSNVVGSNIFNLMVVCGVCTLFVPLAVSVDTLKKEFPFSIICAVLLVIFGKLGMILGRADGIIFLVLFAAYLGWMIKSALSARNSALSKEAEEADEQIKILPVWQCLIYIIGGAVAIKFGGDFVVNGASTIASSLGFSQNLIGLTIVALGTSLPELVTSIVAAKKDEVDMALGNVIGSNIFNILLVLGVCLLYTSRCV